MERCASCGAALSQDEIAVTKKLINRGAKRFFCVSCLAKHFDVTPQDIRDRIAYFRETGCTLFDPQPEEPLANASCLRKETP